MILSRLSMISFFLFFFFFSSRRRHTRSLRDWSSDVCSSDLARVSEGELCDLVTHRVDSAIDQLRREGLPIKAAAGSVKTRHSVITKLLAKKETLAAQIYDRVRYRVVTADREHVLPVLVRLCDLLIPFNFVVPGQTQNTLLSFRKLIHDWPDLKALAPELLGGLHLEDHDRREADPSRADEVSGDSYKVVDFVCDLPVHLPQRAIEPADGRIAYSMVALQALARTAQDAAVKDFPSLADARVGPRGFELGASTQASADLLPSLGGLLAELLAVVEDTSGGILAPALEAELLRVGSNRRTPPGGIRRFESG